MIPIHTTDTRDICCFLHFQTSHLHELSVCTSFAPDESERDDDSEEGEDAPVNNAAAASVSSANKTTKKLMDKLGSKHILFNLLFVSSSLKGLRSLTICVEVGEQVRSFGNISIVHTGYGSC